MMGLTREQFSKMKDWLGVTSLTNTAEDIEVNGQSISFICMSGNIWINPRETAVADDTAIKLTSGQGIDLVSMGNLSIISDATGATYQYIIWDI